MKNDHSDSFSQAYEFVHCALVPKSRVSSRHLWHKGFFFSTMYDSYIMLRTVRTPNPDLRSERYERHQKISSLSELDE